MKNKLGIILLIGLSAALVVIFIAFQYQKNQIRNNVRKHITAGISRNQLLVFKFTREESQRILHWKHHKEFEYKGQMYDVVEIEIKGDTLYYWCWPDMKETRLNKQLNKFLAFALGYDDQHSKSKKGIFKFYPIPPYPKTSVQRVFIYQSSKENFICTIFHTSVSPTPPVPPPKKTTIYLS